MMALRSQILFITCACCRVGYLRFPSQDKGLFGRQMRGGCPTLDASARREVKLHAFVRGHEAQTLVEALGIGAALVGGELDHHRAALPGPRDRPLEERVPHSL